MDGASTSAAAAATASQQTQFKKNKLPKINLTNRKRVKARKPKRQQPAAIKSVPLPTPSQLTTPPKVEPSTITHLNSDSAAHIVDLLTPKIEPVDERIESISSNKNQTSATVIKIEPTDDDDAAIKVVDKPKINRKRGRHHEQQQQHSAPDNEAPAKKRIKILKEKKIITKSWENTQIYIYIQIFHNKNTTTTFCTCLRKMFHVFFFYFNNLIFWNCFFFFSK